MIQNLTRSIKKYPLTVSLRIKNRSNKRIISKFAKKVGLVYFGFVSQHSDDHKIVRGLSVSSTHQDNNYCIGSVSGYNISVVNRSNYVKLPNKSSEMHNLLIMTFDLHTKKTIPHFFIQAKNYDASPYKPLFITYPNMREVELGTFEQYSPEFISRYSLFARPAKSVEVEEVFDAESAMVMGAHFWPLSVEQHDNVLYVYSNNEHVTPHLVDSMFENGLWLAEQLDLDSDIEVKE